MIQNTTAKWYNKKRFLLPVLIIFPPLGIYGAWKSKRKVLSKIVLTFGGIFLSFFLLIIVVAIANPSIGNEKGQKKDQGTTTETLSQIREQDQISTKNSLTTTEIETLKAFQKKWADSIVKSWEGTFITDVKLSLPDTIQFYLSKAASNNVQATRKENLGVYEILYDSSKIQLAENLRSYPVVIDFLPAKGYKIENWVKFQTITYNGIELYTGLANEKEHYGTIIGGYIVDGERYVQILTSNGEIETIERKELNLKAFYYKANDPKIGVAISWVNK
ncbi:hypothetical protein OCK74_17740 [Chitinophagaceae bacterium LB-8]|uniref:Uncharacterized protein n=1 Tax=Paraflavisolibacter caeni TaxID=2982496 RepID=A0A9X2XY51_9BACT|nr:hypothetical protein [Paraflavisolibacter caeni]MCU7550966.1 hypothetical protein [Paraflavisolibacter caeni]